MTIFEIIILSVLEGLTEFLPVSSTGHLILASHLLRIPQVEFTKTFEVVIQLGAILAVLVIYFQKLIREHGLWKKIFVSFLPTATVGLIMYNTVKSSFMSSPLIVVLALFIGGIVLLFIDKLEKFKLNSSKINNLNNITIKQCIYIGLFQAISIIPGVSRSAASIIGGLIVGLPKTQAVEFSFFLAVPTIFAASVFDLSQTAGNLSGAQLAHLGLGIFLSFLVALLSIRWFIGYIKTKSWRLFGIYRILLALLYFFLII